MPRGRPRKVVQPEPTGAEEKVAEILARNCGIPGCSAKHHLEEARAIVQISKGAS